MSIQSRVALRTHIVPVGFEVRRVTEPLIRLRADRVYLVTGSPDDSAKKYWRDVHKALQTDYKIIEVREVLEDMWNFHRLLQRYGGIVQEEAGQGNSVLVNVSTGTKVTAMVGMLSSMFWGTAAYYASTSYGGGTEIVHDVKFLPALHFDVLPREGRSVLRALKQEARPLRKEELIEILRRLELLPGPEEISVPATYRRLESHLEPLVGRGFVEVIGQRRSSRVHLTDEGRSALLLLAPMD